MKTVMNSEIENTKLKVFLRTVLIVVGFISYYIYLYKYTYHVEVYIPYLIALNILNIVTLYIAKKVSLKVATGIISLTAYLTLMILLYAAGSLNSPGAFWITAIPVFHGTLLGRKYTMPSFILSLSSMLFLYLIEPYRETASFINTLEFYQQEKVRNLVLFSCFVYLVVRSYLKIISNSQKKIRDKNDQIDTLLRVLVHDLASPLMILKSYCKKIFSSTNLDPKIVHKCTTSLETMDELLEHVRINKAIEDGKIRLEMEVVNLEMCLEEVIFMLEDKAKEKNIDIKLSGEKIVTEIFGNKQILKNQVFYNLLTNAIKFSYPNTQINVIIEHEEDIVSVSVIDHGIGMPKDIQENLFDVGYKTSRKGTSGEAGTGYGMGLVKSYLQEMGGNLEVDSRPKEENPQTHGTTMKILFSVYRNQKIAA